MDTIFALASAPGRAGVSVFRVSGPQALDAAERLTGKRIPFRRPILSRIVDLDGDLIDTGLVLAFSQGQSFTGEDVVEFQLHGSVAVGAALLMTLGRIPGLRHAEAGEFTRRALENGCLDLTQVEGLADLIDAETDLQRRQALEVANGRLRMKTDEWRKSLLRSVALLEAGIDFVDEELPENISKEACDLARSTRHELVSEIAGSVVSERIREGFEVAIVGKPNIGKSTLLNALAGRDAAITSEVAGTTRDIIEVRMDLRGIPVSFLDTAGMRQASDVVERLGIERARERAEKADIRVFLVEPGEQPALVPRGDDIVMIGKADLHGSLKQSVSGKTGLGISELTSRIADVLSKRVATSSTVIRERQRRSISDAIAYIEVAEREVGAGEGRVEFACEALHRAIRSLDILLGRVDVEDILDEIFSSFCLGK